MPSVPEVQPSAALKYPRWFPRFSTGHGIWIQQESLWDCFHYLPHHKEEELKW